MKTPRKNSITTHVLDTSRGCPASGISVELDMLHRDGEWRRIGDGVTDADGRITDLIDAGPLEPGRYRLTFATGEYFSSLGVPGFYPSITVEFEVAARSEHYHVPLLLSPFGYATYRGS